MSAERLHYRGEDRRGVGRIGVLPDGVTVAAFVEAKYVQRWRALIVEHEPGQSAGEIVNDYDTGKRIWWAEV